MQRKTLYAKSGDVHIAYQVVGQGPRDLILAPGFVSHVEAVWEDERFARFAAGLSVFSRLILFDKRGTGMSDPVIGTPTIEERMDDLRAVIDATGAVRPVLFGYSEGGTLCLLLAATYPDQVSALVLYSTYARLRAAPDYPCPHWPETAFREWIRSSWGTGTGFEIVNPSIGSDERYREWIGSYFRRAASPGMALALQSWNAEIDVRSVLPHIRVPTLILHRTEEQWLNVFHSRFLADHIPNAKLVELPGADHWPWFGDSDQVLAEVAEFLTGERPAVEPDRVLATVLFTDIVGSTERAATLADRGWRGLLESYQALVRRELGRFRGREVKTLGDGFLATFDGPARAIRCACAIRDAVRPLGIEIRAGLHTGECELIGDDVGGIAVHIGARVTAGAAPGEVRVSSTVKDLVAGSGLRFVDRGTYNLHGVPGEWRLFAVEG